jgi:hypothetical protein
MKKIFYSLLLLLFSFSLYSQSWYSEDQRWSYASAIYGWIIGVEQVFVTGETNYDGRDCLVFEQYIEGVEFMGTDVQSTSIEVYAYEENDVVYVHFNESWQAIYDFNMEIGDTLFYTPFECEEPTFYEVLDIGTVEIDGQELRMQTIWLDGTFAPSFIVEKIGYLESEGTEPGTFYGGYVFINEVYGCVLDLFPSRNFHCYKDELIDYNPEDNDCAFISTATQELPSLGTLRLSPNPTIDFLYLEIEQWSEVQELRIFSTSGKLMWKTEQRSEIIDVQSFPTGIYFLQIFDQNGTQNTFKWIKKE